MLLFLFMIGFVGNAQQSFDKASFFASMQFGDLNDIDAHLKIVEGSVFPYKNAYYGALLMKKAGLVEGASNKLRFFKSGRKKLEASIEKNPKNTELRFLRLMVQEHAPGILGYKNNEQHDAEYIKKYFKDLPLTVQQAVSNYSKQSKILKPEDFNFDKNE